MKNFIETYCELELLKSIFDQISKSFSIEAYFKNEENVKSIFAFEELLSKNCELLIDDYDQLLELSKTNPWFKKIIKQSDTGGSIIYDFKKDFEHLKNDLDYIKNLNPKSIHLYESDNDNIISSNKLGFIFCLRDKWQEEVALLNLATTFKIDKNKNANTFLGWKHLRPYFQISNSAIIIDRYLLKDQDNFENNLYQIIDTILPNIELEMDYHLTIISLGDEVPAKERKKKRLTVINEYIESLDRSYSIKLGLLFTTTEYFHDRDILSNYIHCHSGDSFSYFDKTGKTKKNTSLSIFGLNGGELNVHSQICTSLKTIFEKSKNDDDIAFGHVKNRLIYK